MGVDAAIDITTEERQTVLALLQRHLPGTAAWVYGSRVKWTSRPQSDLDLVVFATPEQRPQVGDLREAFEESNLPFRVDLFVWDDVPDSFRKRIEADHTVLRKSKANVNKPRWRRYQVSSLIGGGLLTVGDGYRAKNSELSERGLPFARAGNVAGGFRFQDADHFPEDRLYAVGNKISKSGDVVFTSKGTVGRFAFVRADTERFVYSPQLCFWRSLDHSVIDPRFLYFWMQGPEFFDQFTSVSGQTDMADYVSLTDQRGMFIAAPPVPDQRAIAHILGTLDDKIELNRRMNATLEAMARALFRSWFVDFDPVRAKMERRDTGLPKDIADLFPDRLVDSELGEIPDGWHLKPLDSLASFQNGLALQKFRPSQNEARLPVVKITQLRAGETNGREWASATIKPECIIENGDIVFSWSGSLLVQMWCGGRAALNQHLFKVTSVRYPKWFYLHSMLSHFPEFQRIAKDKATTMGHIRRHHLTEALCVVPPDRVISRVSDTLGGLLERQVANELTSRTLVDLRDLLLPKLVSGKLPVNALETVCEGEDRPASVGAHEA